jgi:hypothetical protein
MSDLSSCYFCGTALDASLERRTLAASGGEPTSVVLCPTCRRKLLGVLERTLVAAPEAERDSMLATAAAAVDDADGESDAPAVADVTPDQGVAGPPAVATGADGEADDTADDGADESNDDTDDPDAADDVAHAQDRSASATTEAGETDPIFANGDEATPNDGGPAFGDDDPAAEGAPGEADPDDDAQAPAEADASGGDDGAETQANGDVVREAEPNGGGSDTEASAESEPGPAADSAGGPAAAGDPSGDAPSAGEGPDVETYNRVIRLLQNREFPVQTAEIEEVAVNAYGIDPVDFRAVIDAAVEREVIEERGDRLVRAN